MGTDSQKPALVAAVIAAGEGTRMRMRFPNTSKPLIPFRNSTLIDWLLDQLETTGFSHIKIVIRENDQHLENHLMERKLNAQLQIIKRNTLGGMLSFLELRDCLIDFNEFFLFTVDNVFDPRELGTFVQSKEEFTKCVLTTWITDRNPKADGQVGVRCIPPNRITEIGKHLLATPFVAEGPFYCQPGVFAVADIALNSGLTRFTDYLRLLSETDDTLYGYYVSPIFDVDTYTDLEAAEDFLESLSRKVNLP